MKIIEVIQKVKDYHKGGNIDESKTRDKVLYGDISQECTGIVTTCWASMEVIRSAHQKGANLIICHEALFWNHGDHIDWLEEQQNAVFLKKKELLDLTGIVIWRDHDYIHSGIPLGDGNYVDGIFYGVAKEMAWDQYMVCEGRLNMLFDIPAVSADIIAAQIIEKFQLEGLKIVGNLKTNVHRILFAAHIFGNDNELITQVDKEEVDLILPLEAVDYTFSEYVRDSVMMGRDRVMLLTGHFNGEEPGMKYMTSYLQEAVGENIRCCFIPSGDMYHYKNRDYM